MNWFQRTLSKITVEHLWALTVMVGIFAFVNTHPIRPHDFWWHIAVGRDIVASGQIPEVDTYSYTWFGQPYPSYKMFWLMEIVLYSVFHTGGAILVILAQSFMVTTAYGVMLWICYWSSRSWRAAAFGVLFAAALGFGNWNVRPQAVTYLLGALVFLGISEYRRTKNLRWVILLPLVMVFWANSHGSFPIGLMLMGCWVADEAWKFLQAGIRKEGWKLKPALPAAVGTAVSALACLISPQGIGIIAYLKEMATDVTVQNYIMEWMPPTLNSLEGGLFYVGLMLLAVLLAVSPKRPNFFELITFLVFGLLGIRYIRGIVWFGLIMAPVVAVHLGALFEQLGWNRQASRQTAQMRRLNGIFIAALLFLAFISLPWFKHLFPFVPAKRGLISVETPIQATQFLLDNHLPAEVFGDMAFGSYLIWTAQPDYKVFVDPRIEMFPAKVWDDYWAISTAQPNWEQLLDQYQVNTLMLEQEKQALLVTAARSSPNWKEVYAGKDAVIFTRK
jgi:hypothetical protein